MKKLVALLLALLLCAAVCCAQAEYPVTVTDQAGRTVTIEDMPERIVSGYYISTSALIALDLDASMVGIEAKADKRPIYRLSAPALIDLPNVGTAKSFDLEGCAALNPDLVILPLKLKSAAQTLESLGVDVLLVNPENASLLEEMVRMIAAATGTISRAEELLAFTGKQAAMLEGALQGKAAPSVYLAGNSSLLSTAGAAMHQSSLITMAGGVNAAAQIEDAYWAEISYEQLLAWDPEYIILASDATYTTEDVLADANLADCSAVKNDRVFKLPGSIEAWDSPVPASVLGAVWLASVLHDDAVTQDAYLSLADEFYTEYYGFACIDLLKE